MKINRNQNEEQYLAELAAFKSQLIRERRRARFRKARVVLLNLVIIGYGALGLS